MKFLNAARQQAVVETLLPLRRSARRSRNGEAPAAKVEYEFLPDAAGILEEILPVSFKVRLFKCFLDAAVSEQIARRVAMKAATENADDMIKKLSREYNRARQAKITKEIVGDHRRRRGVGITDRSLEATVSDMVASKNGVKDGRVVQVIGSTFDVEFEEGHLPEIYNALKVDSEAKGVQIRLTGEVQQHLGGNRVRASPSARPTA